MPPRRRTRRTDLGDDESRRRRARTFIRAGSCRFRMGFECDGSAVVRFQRLDVDRRGGIGGSAAGIGADSGAVVVSGRRHQICGPLSSSSRTSSK